MSLDSNNPLKTKSWLKLINHFKKIKDIHILEHFISDKSRGKKFSIKWKDFLLDFSKNNIDGETINLFQKLLNEINLKASIEKYFSGEKINLTESRPVLHTALRADGMSKILVEGKNIMSEIAETRDKIKLFSHEVISGNYKGFKGDKIEAVVNIGIGGSELGPSMVVESLYHYKNHIKTYFISNVDGDHVQDIISDLLPEKTLFIIVSKTFTTTETLTNANTVREWFLKSAEEKDIPKHFVAVSSNVDEVINYGIDPDNIFPMWNWVGGRFSLWGSAGLSISLSIGYQNFSELLEGAREMDIHFKTSEYSENIPVILACISLWYNNFFNYHNHGIIAYSEYLKNFSKYLQQASMESNGKQTDRSGNFVNYETGQIIWGQTGSNAQHSFFQLLHQGTKIVPLDFIGFSKPLKGNNTHHNILMSNFFAQTKALMTGTFKIKVNDNHKFFNGNRPTNTILIEKLSPKNLGSLISLYEHKIFTLGLIWNIFSFDQFGVELGKKLAKNILSDINSGNYSGHDSSTESLLKEYIFGNK